MLMVTRSDSRGSLGCGCRTTPSHVARCARELSGDARRTRNGWSCSTRPCAGHRVAFPGFADVLRALGSRPTATFCPPRSRRKTSDASGGEWRRQGECCPLWPPNLGFLCDSRSDERLFVQPLLTPRDSHTFETQDIFSRGDAVSAEKRKGRVEPTDHASPAFPLLRGHRASA